MLHLTFGGSSLLPRKKEKCSKETSESTMDGCGVMLHSSITQATTDSLMPKARKKKANIGAQVVHKARKPRNS